MAVEIGALRALLSLDSAAFEKGAKRAQASMGNIERRMRDVGRNVANAGKVMAAGFAAGITALATGSVAASRALTDLSNQARLAGLSAEEFKILSIASQTLGIEQEKLADILKDVDDKFGDFATTGQGPLKDFFEEIAPKVGLTQEAFEGLSSSEALQLYVSALEDANVSQQQMTFFMEAIADEATALIPLFKDNGAAIKEMTARAKELGLSLDGETITAATKAREEFGIVAEVMKTQLAAALSEILPALADLGSVVIPAIISVMDEVAAIISSVAALLRGDFKGAWELIEPLVTGAANSAKTALIGLATAAPGVIADLAAALLDALAGLVSRAFEKAKEIGSQIVAGIRQGINDLWENFKADIIGRFTGFVDGVKDLFQIRSPSRVFMEIGRNIMAGLGIGVADGEALATGPLQGATERMVGQMGGLQDSFEATGERFGDMVADIVTGSRTIDDVIKSMLDQLIRNGISAGIEGIASGGGLFGKIASVFAGLFDGGGRIGAGQFGIVGERGPEIVTGPANVTSRVDTAKMLGGGQVVNNITVNAPPGSDVQEQRRQNSTGGEDLTIIIDRAVSNLARDPGSALSRTLGQNFGLRPATRGR